MRALPPLLVAAVMALPAAATTADTLGAWTPLGPDNVGGRTRALVVHPHDPQILYAGAVSGGVWKSGDRGASWQPAGDMPNLTVTALAIDPKDPDVLYAGTGESFYRRSSGYHPLRGGGIFKSADGGASWARLPGTRPSLKPVLFDHFAENMAWINDVVVSPLDSRRIYAATPAGVMRSRNGGKTFVYVFEVPLGSTEFIDGCTDLALRTEGGHDFLLAACGVFRSGIVANARAEGTGKWNLVYRDTKKQDGFLVGGRISLAVAPSDGRTVYAVEARAVPPNVQALHRVLRSTKGGVAGSWQVMTSDQSSNKLHRLLLSNVLPAFSEQCGLGADDSLVHEGRETQAIAVDPEDPKTVWVGGVELFRSNDGGVTWGLASNSWTAGANPAASYVHADQHVIAFPPDYDGKANQTMYVAGDGGIFRTANARAAVAASASVCEPDGTAVVWRNRNHGYSTAQFHHGAVLPDLAGYLGGTRDNGTLTAFGPPSGAWGQVLDGEGGYVAVDPRDSQVLYAEHTELSFHRSDDGGATWVRKTAGITDPPFVFKAVTPFAIDPTAPDRLLLGGSSLGRIWATENRGESWRVLASPLSTLRDPVSGERLRGSVGAVALRGDTWIAGMGRDVAVSGTVSRLANWDYRSDGPLSTEIQSVVLHPVDPKVFFATSSRVEEATGLPFEPTFRVDHVWTSTDGGVTWRSIDGGGAGRLPDVPVYTLAADPAAAGRLFVGTDRGIFSTTDGGESWRQEGGFPNVATLALSLVTGAEGRYLVAFTHGRGAWQARLLD